jgi:class 3 adenylate cyclase
MATTTATRRLTAILAADLAGYSRLMGEDEEGTDELFKAHFDELIDPKIREHRGRIVNGNTTDLFALQDEITRRIAIDLNLKLIGAQAARPTDNPDTLDYIFRGRAALLKPPSRENYAKAISFFDHALALHPRSVEAQSRLAIAL